MARVAVIGGGFGGLEAAFTLRRLAGDKASITLFSDRDHFYFKPNSIYVPFGMDESKLRVPLEKPLSKAGIEFRQGSVRGVDPTARRLATDSGEVSYDFLVIATGAGMRADEIPGLGEHAISTWDAADMLRLRDAFGSVAERAGAGERRRVLFLVPPNNKCSGPLYEIVLMLETWLRRQGARDPVEIVWTTYEHTFIQAFGPRLHELVGEEFARRGIEGHTELVVTDVDERQVHYESGESLGFDLLVAFPPYVAAEQFAGLPADDRGFLSTELTTRRVEGHPEIFAVGDAGDFPVKQAFLAFVQGDAAAGEIAAELDPAAQRAPFDPVSMCVMEQFDKATFAKVPLRLTGDSDAPVEVRPGAENDYVVGSSRVWRLGKKMLGLSVPWRFRHGRPFHSGPFWSAMDAGLGVMSRLFARRGA